MRVLTAVAPWDPPVLLPPGYPGLEVAHRSCDVEDLLAVAATGVAEVALVSSELPRLDLDVVARLTALGVAVVGLAPAGDDAARRRLEGFRVAQVLSLDASAEALHAVSSAVLGASGGTSAVLRTPRPRPAVDPDEARRGGGRVVAVWGPAGSPGRTTVASGVAAEVARRGYPALLVDADPYGGCLGPWLAAEDDGVSGLAAACRRANRGGLEPGGLEGLSVAVARDLRLLTGLDRAARWPELRPPAVESVLGLARACAAVTVVDTGFCLEQDEELTYDTLAPQRNGATLAALRCADLVLVVGGVDRVALGRLLAALAELQEVLPDAPRAVVLNRARASAVPGLEEARAVLSRHAGSTPVGVLPEDRTATDTALATGRPVDPATPLGEALGALATTLVGRP